MPTVTSNPPYGDLLTKTEQAWKDLLVAGFGSPVPSYLTRRKTDETGTENLPIQLGEDDATMRRPLIICAADRDATEGTGASHFLVTATIQIQSFHHELVATHHARVAWFEDLWQGYDRNGQGYAALAAALTNHAKQFHCHGLYPEGATRTIVAGVDGDFWVFTRPFTMSCQWVNGVA
jgi:hypothetical protein